MKGFNVVCLAGNLTREPEIKHTPGGTMLANLRLAVNERRRDANGNWFDYANYFNVTVWGGKDGAPGQAGVCQQYLHRGSPVLIRGSLQWREWEDRETGAKRQAVDVVAREVVLLGGGQGGGGNSGGEFQPSAATDEPDFVPSGVDDDIPF